MFTGAPKKQDSKVKMYVQLDINMCIKLSDLRIYNYCKVRNNV